MRRTARNIKRKSKRISKRTFKRRTRKQSGRGIDINMDKLNLVLNNRSRAAELAEISAKKAQKLREQIESF